MVGLTIDSDDPSNPAGVVNLRDQVHDLTGAVPDGACEVVNVVIGARIGLLFTSKDRPTGAFVAGSTQAAVILTRCALNVVRCAALGLQEAAGRHWRLATLR